MAGKTETTRAIVLRRYPFRESDSIVVMLTENLGMVRALAKGMRRSKKRFGGIVDLLNHLEVDLTRRKSEIMLFGGARLLDCFYPLSHEPMRAAAGFHVAEVASAFASENQPEPEIYALLAKALRALAEGSDPAAVSRALELRVLGAAGLAPRLDICTATGRPLQEQETVAFEPRHGGSVCLNRADPDSPRLSPATRSLMIRVLAAPENDLPLYAWPRKQSAETRAAMHAAILYHHGRPLRARAFAEKANRFTREHKRK